MKVSALSSPPPSPEERDNALFLKENLEKEEREMGWRVPPTAIQKRKWKSGCTRAFDDGPRNFEPWSSDVDDT
ncbi:hypothetical protein TNCV_1360411 [Trichonephila clavipes]|nr:hypothetical protein TNCV_1360411 [Trichonephila clavipes]